MTQCKECGSFAVNHHLHGRDGSDGDLCDVCYWRKRAQAPTAEPHQPAEWLLELANRIDPDELWRRPLLETLDLPPEQAARLEAAVNLRRYADLLGEGHWRVFPPRRGICFRSSTLAGAVDMAQRDEERRVPSPGSVEGG